MYTGYTALSMAEALPDEGVLITMDISEKCKKFAEKYFAQSLHGKKIHIKIGLALESLKKMKEPFDFIFIDADKGNYLQYYEISLSLLRKGGLMALDNCLWNGKVLDPKAIHAVNQFISTDTRVENVILTVRDGINLVRKL
jgi:caffeoyl-CoA O-methyltransferase